MTKRDFDAKGEVTRGTDAEPHIPESKKHYSDEAKGIAEVNVKNAHASGDGSIGRNDTRIGGTAEEGDPEID